MGRGARMRPSRLPEKILQVRVALGETQEGMVRRLGFPEFTREYVSGFERGTREPPLPVLLRVANLAGVHVEVLIDDELDLPDELPANPKSSGVKRRLLPSNRQKR
jgi:transcriptional regulator with XRE-family HTH domain